MADRFHEATIHIAAFQAVHDIPVADRSQHDEDHVADLGVGFNRRGQRRAVDARHLIIGQDKMVRIAFSPRLPDCHERLFARSKASVTHAPTRNLFVQDAAIDIVVVNDQHAQAAEIVGRSRPLCTAPLRALKAE